MIPEKTKNSKKQKEENFYKSFDGKKNTTLFTSNYQFGLFFQLQNFHIQKVELRFYKSIDTILTLKFDKKSHIFFKNRDSCFPEKKKHFLQHGMTL